MTTENRATFGVESQEVKGLLLALHRNVSAEQRKRIWEDVVRMAKTSPSGKSRKNYHTLARGLELTLTTDAPGQGVDLFKSVSPEEFEKLPRPSEGEIKAALKKGQSYSDPFEDLSLPGDDDPSVILSRFETELSNTATTTNEVREALFLGYPSPSRSESQMIRMQLCDQKYVQLQGPTGAVVILYTWSLPLDLEPPAKVSPSFWHYRVKINGDSPDAKHPLLYGKSTSKGVRSIGRVEGSPKFYAWIFQPEEGTLFAWDLSNDHKTMIEQTFFVFRSGAMVRISEGHYRRLADAKGLPSKH